MINYFLNEQQGITDKKRKIIRKTYLSHRRYNPFHINCQFSKRKLCYCRHNPVQGMDDRQKLQLWEKNYRKVYEFFEGQKQKKEEEDEKKNDECKNEQIQELEKQKSKAGLLFGSVIKKIQSLSVQEVCNFIKQNEQKLKSVPNDYDFPPSTTQF